MLRQCIVIITTITGNTNVHGAARVIHLMNVAGLSTKCAQSFYMTV